MRVTAIHRYFWPDSPPYASFLRQISSRWVEDGHQVEILTGQPTYASAGEQRPRVEALDGVRIRRLPVLRDRSGGWRQLANLVAFPMAVALRILVGRRPDVVMCSTVPQVTLGVAVSVAAGLRRAPFVYHCMDLHPEIGRISGEFAHPVVYGVLSRLDLFAMRRASRIVVLSEDMRSSVVARDAGLADRVVILNNWALPDFAAPEPSPLAEPAPGVLRIVFTGNLGRFQGLEEIVSGLSDLPDGVRLEMVFMGEGRAKPDVERAALALASRRGVNVVFVPQGPPSAAKALMRTAHVGLVTLVPDVVRYAYPSKTATYATEGLPLLVVCEQESELAQTVRDQGLGWSVAAGDRGALVAALTDAAAELARDEMAPRRRVVAEYATMAFGQQAALDRWSELLTEISKERS
ncbi:glycosyltransferase family 4 protein [Janibacter terrae]|uniref:glycosyltransferase family 4 protein n=1 Tax=Janibacter terrae TaxID=103817 RepID=UPI00382D6377